MLWDVPDGVDLVEGDMPGSNFTYVKVKDSSSFEELVVYLKEEGYDVTAERY